MLESGLSCVDRRCHLQRPQRPQAVALTLLVAEALPFQGNRRRSPCPQLETGSSLLEVGKGL